MGELTLKTHKVCTICGENKSISEFHVVNAEKNHIQGRCKPCSKEYLRVYHRQRTLSHPEEMATKYRRYTLKKRFGMTLEDYDKLLAEQGGVCAICGGEDQNGKRLAVDHDHDTDAVRGLLCTHCNTALGLLKDDAGLLLRATQYLSRSLN